METEFSLEYCDESDSDAGVRKVLKPYRTLTRQEKDILRRKGIAADDPQIIEAFNIFEGTIVE